MNSAKENKINFTTPFYFILALGCLLLAYTVSRAALLSFTPDEIFTQGTFSKKFLIYPESYNFMSANHHWLNSWAIYLSRSLFGESELAIRLPNLFAHILYLFFTGRLILMIRKDFFAVAGFIILNAHPYLLDFFSLARGYGISFGCLAVCLFFFHQFIYGQKTKHLIFTLLAGAFSVLASFTILNIFIPLSVILMALTLFQKKTDKAEISKIKRSSQFGIVFLFNSGLLALILPHLIRLKKANALYFGSSKFLDGTIRSICEGLLYDAPYKGHDVLRSCLPSLYLILATILIGCALIFIQKKWKEPQSLFALCLAFILAACVSAMWIQHILLMTLFPVQRAGLFIFIIFLFAFTVSLATLPFRSKYVIAFAYLLALPISFHMIYNANFHYVIEWRGCADTDHFAKRIMTDNKQKKVVIVSADGEPSCSLYWIKDKWKLDWMEVTGTWTYDALPKADYYIITKFFAPFRNTKNWKLIDSCPVSQNALYIDTTSIYYRK
jgi:hypothetical protein